MTNEEKQLLEDTAKKLDDFLDVYNRYNFPAKQVFIKDVEFKGQININSIEPTLFGLGLTPIARQSAIAAPVLGVTIDVEARSAINSIRAVLIAFGLTS